MQFGGGCTAEIVSQEGLILTNHHCGLGAIQHHSSLQHDYLANGFWARSFDEELPNQGITATILVRMEDVTGKVLQGVNDQMNLLQRNEIIKQHIEKLERESAAGTHYEARIKPFYYGNQYYLFINEVFRDVRLVGAPPSNIGKFGGDTDNWMWPRHTGDFSIFRIYVNKNNEPADYSKDNVPYKPKNYLPVSLKGYKPGDFTFVFGYPGSTREYIPSFGVDLIANRENPLRVGLRQQRLDIINAAMEKNRLVRIQYAAKANGIANFWKKMIGESRGIDRLGAVSIKEQQEKAFTEWVASNPGLKNRYAELLPMFRNVYGQYLPLDLSAVCISEAGQGIEIVRFASGFRDLVKTSKNKTAQPADFEKTIANLRKNSREFYRNYSPAVDREIMCVMLHEMALKMDKSYRIYMAGLMEMQQNRRFYPDANSTLRVAYGKVDNYQPADGVTYNYFTTLAGVMQKEDSAVYDYQVDSRLKKLYKDHDYGPYADHDGTMHVAFTASNHTTGGNSGSPVLNAEGQLIGINFDRNWEGTLSDLMYDPSQCRNISLDIRYCLFVIDKVAGDDRLIREMKIIQP